MNIFKQLESFFKRRAPSSQRMGVGRIASPPIYQAPPTTEHALRFTEQVTPQAKTPLSQAISKPISRQLPRSKKPRFDILPIRRDKGFY